MFVRLVFLMLICVSARADVSYWDGDIVRAYVHNLELQRRWAVAFLAPHLRAARGDERILDIGCGDGKVTADIAKFILEGEVIGIDPLYGS